MLSKLRLPVVLAPMAGVTTPQLVVAACKSGILGFHAGGFRQAVQLEKDILEIKGMLKDDEVFGVNLFAGKAPEMDEERIETATKNLEKFYKDVGIEESPKTFPATPILKDQIEILVKHKIPYVSFCFGILDKESIKKLQANGNSKVGGTATSVEEAKLLESQGVDYIIAQGADAGGHRGSFLENSSLVGTFSLIPQIVDNVSIPVIAAGGIMDGRGIKAAISLGANGVQMGTAFVTSQESEANNLYKERLLNAKETDTVVTDLFSGRAARGLYNKFIEEYPKTTEPNINKHRVCKQVSNVAPYPIQQALTNPIKAKGDLDLSSMWCGQAVTLATNNSVENIVQHMENQFKQQ